MKRDFRSAILNYRLLSLYTLIFILIVIIFMRNKDLEDDIDLLQSEYDAKEVLIHNHNCKIPKLDPFSPIVMSFFNESLNRECYKKKPLTYIEKDENFVSKLMIDDKVKRSYLVEGVTGVKCCYQQIFRSRSLDKADNNFTLSNCKNFSSGHKLTSINDEFLIVRCKTEPKNLDKEIYVDAHAIVVRKVLPSLHKPKEVTNVLLLGIDSVSRLNFMRSMPKTFKYVTENGWYDMRAYNKIGDNTYPNLQAVLTGKNLESVDRECNKKKVGELDKCRFLWNDYKDAKYVTAYAEDCQELMTFNTVGKGFLRQPTDHYLRPFTLAAEKNVEKIKSKPWLVKCLGNRYYADVVYQYAVDFAEMYQNELFFGLFWANSFSHDELNNPTEYDDRMIHYLDQLKIKKILNNTIIIFFSDHGMRFGDIRKTFTGWLEDRLPFLYFWLPESFKNKFPEFTGNLEINQGRLVSPYDVHLTLKHILEINGGYEKKVEAEGCPTCQSLFIEIKENRTCSEAGIAEQFCACNHFGKINENSTTVKNLASIAVKKLNSNLKVFTRCAKLELSKILSARKFIGKSNFELLIAFEVSPSNGEMEANLNCEDKRCKNPQVVGEISRINSYGNQSRCIDHAIMRKYCYCF